MPWRSANGLRDRHLGTAGCVAGGWGTGAATPLAPAPLMPLCPAHWPYTQALPKGMGSMVCLEVLDVCNNRKLAALPACLGAAPALRKLNLHGCNRLAALPSEWAEPPDGGGGSSRWDGSPVALPAFQMLCADSRLQDDPVVAVLKPRAMAMPTGSVCVSF